MTKKQTVRTRYAPSPTGELHVGGLAMLLKNYAFAKKHQGQFILRIEDTDRERLVPGASEKLMAVIREYGLDWDEGPDKDGPFGPYVQSQRLDLYRQEARHLLEKDKAYYCFCSKERLAKLRKQQQKDRTPPKYDQHCRSLTPDQVSKKLDANQPHVIRLKVPDNDEIVFSDLLRGKIRVHSSIIDDQVLMKSDDFPTYHLAAVVDDHHMKISHVCRGEEWLSSTPKHVLLYRAFGWTEPVFVHFPVFLSSDGKGKMSKRQGDVSAQSFLDRGFLPEALLNFLMILGWTPTDQREVLSLKDYIREFDPKDVNQKSVAFDLKKLGWLNGLYIRQLSSSMLKKKLTKFIPKDFPKEKLDDILDLVKERLTKLADFQDLTDFFYKPITPDPVLLIKKVDAKLVSKQLAETGQALSDLEKWTVENIEEAIRSLQEKNSWHKRQYFMMLRVAVTGQTFTPPLFETMQVLGEERVIKRLGDAKKLVSQAKKVDL